MPVSVESLPETTYFNDVMDFNTAGVYCLLSPSNTANGKAFVHYSKDIHKLLKIAYSKPFSHRNCYMTVNTLASWHRDEHNVLGLNGLFIDVDCMKNGVSKGKLLWYLPRILKLSKLPVPNVKMDSGHGVYLKWYFDKQVIVHNQSINRLWNKLERSIVERFNRACKAVLGVKLGDPKATDSSRVLRVVNTWNVKSKPVQCRLIDYRRNARFDMFKYWVKRYLPVIHYQHRKPRHRKFRRKINIKIVKNGYTLNGYRLNDLLTWLKLHGFNITGKREEFLFIYTCNALNCEALKTVIRDVNDLNDRLSQPLPQSEIENLVIEMTHVNLRKYQFKNQTIIDKLGITISDQRRMKTLIGSKVNYQRYRKRLLKLENRRKNERRIKRSKRNQKKLIRNNKIISLHDRGVNNSRIARDLKTSRRTVIRIIRGVQNPSRLYSVLEKRSSRPSVNNIHIVYKNIRLLKYLSKDINLLISNDKNINYDVRIRRIRDD